MPKINCKLKKNKNKVSCKKKSKVIIIEIYQGIFNEVKGLPKGYSYHVKSWD